ncbi:hypothetical protein L207DRAFT_593676 [Hyaloscypha variabilis F]|uniref:Uncharacterized protein n=1 Tax=Hyaloscypha variabilis (strain UAMH 11265 / GT02V1 / F) TaxID=1149755 RepID=A0A2J6QSM4_HYAVF|nr:hypothetical protein L207DRAFT_593676 [Hyaloscypha variabilis F]
MAPNPSARPASSLHPSSINASSMLPSVIRSHHLEDDLPLGEGSLASKLFLLEKATQRPSEQSQVQTSKPLQTPGSFPKSVLPTLTEPNQKSRQVKSSTPLSMPGSFPTSILPYRPHPRESIRKPSPSVKADKPMQIPGSFPVSVLPRQPESIASTQKPPPKEPTKKPSRVKPVEPIPVIGSFQSSNFPNLNTTTQKTSQVRSSESIQMPGSFPASTMLHLKTTTQKSPQVRSTKPSSAASGPRHLHSSHRPPSSIRGRPPNILELNAALLEYLSKSTGQIIWGLLKAWTTSWGLFKFDRDNFFEVIDLLVQDIEHAVAEQTKDFICRAGIAVEKEQILRMVRMLKGMIVRKVQRHLGLG